MQIKKLLPLLILVFTGTLQAQDWPGKSELAPCGTAPQLDPWLLKYQANPDFLAQESNDTLYAGVQIHLLARDNGTGRFPADRLLDAFCQLNQDFKASAIQFYFKNDWNLLNNSGWHQHDSLTQGIQMMLLNNAPDALNAYFVSGPAGNCGYNLPYAGVAIGHGCAGPGSHTWAHEVGHALALPHPFIGWEAKVYNFNTPTPDTLTYDYTHFHSSPDTIVPAPLDTALVEYLDGSNCGIAADRICDTKPDYLSYSWNCNAQGFSNAQQKDPSGATFFSDGSLFMSYANDICQNRFSPDQIQIMRGKLQTVKSSWLAPKAQGGPIADLPQLVAPLNSDPAPSSGALLHWHPTPGATHYLVQASRVSSFAIREFELVTTDTFAVTTALLSNQTYYWRVRPFNSSYTCAAFTANGKFLAMPVSKVQSASVSGWKIYPTLLDGSRSLSLELPESWTGQPLNCTVFNASGKLIWEQQLEPSAPKLALALPASQWADGLYYLIFCGQSGVIRQSIAVAKQ